MIFNRNPCWEDQEEAQAQAAMQPFLVVACNPKSGATDSFIEKAKCKSERKPQGNLFLVWVCNKIFFADNIQ